MSIKKISMGELYQRFAEGLAPKELILDVREPDEFAEGHVKGARNIPVDFVDTHLEELRRYEAVYVHCMGGGRAGRVCETLRRAGLNNMVHVADSGMRSWIESGWPTEKA